MKPIHKLRKTNYGVDNFAFLRFTVSEANTRVSIKRNYITGVAFSESSVYSEVADYFAA